MSCKYWRLYVVSSLPQERRPATPERTAKWRGKSGPGREASPVVANALRNVIKALALPAHGEEAETLCRLKDYLGTAGLRLTISPR